jgi:hypothetical protein
MSRCLFWHVPKLVRSSVKASQVRSRQHPRDSVDRLLLPRRSRPRKARDRSFDADELKKLWSDPQRLKQILGESDPE